MSSLLVSTHDLCWLHDPGPGHPESSLRLTAVRKGRVVGLGGRLTGSPGSRPRRPIGASDRSRPPALPHRPAPGDLSDGGGGRHRPRHHGVGRLGRRRSCGAAGAGLDLIDRLDRGEAEVGWSVVRPPGHHATAGQSDGVLPLQQRGGHGQGHWPTVASGWSSSTSTPTTATAPRTSSTPSPNVLFVSFHQFPWYPFSGRPDEVGEGDGLGATLNVALPAGATGDVYHRAIDEVVQPVVERFGPTWVLVSTGFDGHRADPLTDLGLTSADYADLVAHHPPLRPSRAAACCSSRAATTCGPWPTRPLRWPGSSSITRSDPSSPRPAVPAPTTSTWSARSTSSRAPTASTPTPAELTNEGLVVRCRH